jgi:hypothetical protein
MNLAYLYVFFIFKKSKKKELGGRKREAVKKSEKPKFLKTSEKQRMMPVATERREKKKYK